MWEAEAGGSRVQDQLDQWSEILSQKKFLTINIHLKKLKTGR
jgi:hypothetical protein